jgi:hypothetical protein
MSGFESRDFLSVMQEAVAIAAIGPSSLRNQGVAGLIDCVREFLSKLDLRTFVQGDQTLFQRQLGRQTRCLLDILEVKSWGAARKGLNLFLRDVLYNRYLCDHFDFQLVEPWLEIPLDSAVTQGLKARCTKGSLPTWPGLKRLTENESDLYQTFAQSLADQAGIARVHLDMYLWLENRRRDRSIDSCGPKKE